MAIDRYDLTARPATQRLPPRNGHDYAGPSVLRPAERQAILAATRNAGRVLEIGTFAAASARWIADHRPACQVIGIDTFAQCGAQNIVYALQNFRRTVGKNLFLFVGTAQDYQRLHPMARFDVVIVDADHRYPAVKQDLATAELLTKPGGLILAHDNDAAHPGVVKALAEFLAAHGWKAERQVDSLAIIRVAKRG